MVLQLIVSILQLIVRAYASFFATILNLKGDMVRDPRIVS